MFILSCGARVWENAGNWSRRHTGGVDFLLIELKLFQAGLCVSRGTANVINLNLGVLVLPVCRSLVAFLRNPWLQVAFIINRSSSAGNICMHTLESVLYAGKALAWLPSNKCELVLSIILYLLIP